MPTIWYGITSSTTTSRATTPPPFDLLYWNNGSANLPPPMHTFFLRNMYLKNNLAKPGAIVLCGVPIDVGSIRIQYTTLLRAKTILHRGRILQVDFLFGRPGTLRAQRVGAYRRLDQSGVKNKRNYWVNDKLVDDAEQWLEHAESRPGSWWQDWDGWLAPQSGELVAAPAALGNKQHRPLEASGQLCKEKAVRSDCIKRPARLRPLLTHWAGDMPVKAPGGWRSGRFGIPREETNE